MNIIIDGVFLGSIEYINSTPVIITEKRCNYDINLYSDDRHVPYEFYDLSYAKYVIFDDSNMYYNCKCYSSEEDIAEELRYKVILIVDRFYDLNVDDKWKPLMLHGYAKELASMKFEVLIPGHDIMYDKIGINYADRILTLIGDRQIECDAVFKDGVLVVTKLYDELKPLEIEDIPYTYTVESMIEKRQLIQNKFDSFITERLKCMRNSLHAIADAIDKPEHMKLYRYIVRMLKGI